MSASAQPIIALTGAAVVATLIFLALALRSHRRSRARSSEPLPAPDEKPAASSASPLVARVGQLMRPSDPKALEQLRDRLAQAGIYSRDAVDLYQTVRLTLSVATMVAFLALLPAIESFIGAVLLLLVTASIAVLGPRMWVDMRTRRRQSEVTQNLPATLDLLVTCLEAGLNLEQALARICADSHYEKDLLARELGVALEEIRAGLSTSAAFDRLAGRLGHEEVRNLAALIGQASVLGSNISRALKAHANNMRHHRIVFLEEQAGRANAKLTLPLALCLLPAIILLLMGPAIVVIIRTM